ncbi:MAG: hypothetical protein DI623_01750 [Sphingomonas sanxanigenens]|uniref:Helix-turn-helix domain-containing protein n=1 Tax=Sphingomonas sanxanigenens TaxID=397260 RepID=A0A2W5AHQ6_9SPHN|nr:MAG: hypothetical protein DI623_01750 [Sphingomonas sanxanigenens]
MARLMTAKQVAEEFGIPSERTVRTMRADGLPAVRFGKAYLFDPDDVRGFIASRKVTTCRARTEVPISTSSATVGAGISNGAKPGAPGSSARALEIAKRLKSPSPTSSVNASEPAGRPGRVIRADFPSTTR